MENAAFEREDSRRGCCPPVSATAGGGGGGDSTVEMSEVPVVVAGVPPVAPPLQLNINGNGVMTCSEHCQSLHLQHQKHYEKGDPPAPESPWHHLKTIFLVGTLVFLALWVLVYTLLSQLSLL